MIAFAIVAVLMLAAAAALILVPLLRGADSVAVDQDTANVEVLRSQLRDLDGDLARGLIGETDHAQARRELERRVLDELAVPLEASSASSRGTPWVPVIIAAVLPVLALTGYLAVGSPGALTAKHDAAIARAEHPDFTPDQVEQMVQKLAARMQTEPENVEGWTMLARAYLVMRRFDQAAAAFDHLLKRAPANPDLLADYADALAASQEGRLAGKPLEAVKRALAVDAKHPKALALAGTEAFDRGDYAAAIGYWERLKATAPSGSDFARQVEAGIADARERAGLERAPASAGSAAAASVRIAGRVTVAAPLAGQVAPGDTVFVFARAADGPPLPLAAIRREAKDLPFEFTLDPSSAMAGGRSLADVAGPVVVGARVSKSGSATPQSGDLEGFSQPVRPGATGVVVTIGASRP